MREMKDSGVEWIGEIPVNWDLRKVKYLVKLIYDKSESNENYVGLENVESWTGNFLDSHNEAFEAEGQSISIKKGDLLFGKLRPYLAKAAIVNENGSSSTEFLVLRCEHIVNKFLWRIMLSPKFIDEVNMSTYGAKMPRASWAFIGNMYVPLPDIAEQKKIMRFLDEKCTKIDDIVKKQQVIVEKLKEYKLSIITEIVSKGLNEQGEKITTGLKWQPYSKKDWRKYRIKNICTFYNGDRSSNYPNPEDFIEDGIPFLGADSLNDFYVDRFVAKHITREKYESMSGLKIEHGDILYTLRGSTIGKSALADFNDGTVASSLMGIRVKAKQQVNYRYLFYWFQSNNEFVQRDICINGSTAPNLSAENVKNFILYLPKMSEQNRAVAQMDVINENIDRAIVARTRMIESLQKYKKSLIYEVVTGKREV